MSVHTPKNIKSCKLNPLRQRTSNTMLPSLLHAWSILHLLFKRSAIPFPTVYEYKRYQTSFLPLAVRLESKTYLQAIKIYYQAHQVFLQLSDANQMVLWETNCCSQALADFTTWCGSSPPGKGRKPKSNARDGAEFPLFFSPMYCEGLDLFLSLRYLHAHLCYVLADSF